MIRKLSSDLTQFKEALILMCDLATGDDIDSMDWRLARLDAPLPDKKGVKNSLKTGDIILAKREEEVVGPMPRIKIFNWRDGMVNNITDLSPIEFLED